jgi:D-alanyl-lipoteichoic acid acyltransferase DltB (MBOAT superfamily)
MLFNAPEFILAFLPATLAGFYLIGATGRQTAAILWLVAASLFFYSWWRADYVPLLLASLAFNYLVGSALARRPRRWLLALGVAADLAALGWFKYAGFLAELANGLADAGLPVPQILLPLAISFYTFNQIAYLVDAYSGETRDTGFLRYMLFVVFFPHLIAGPIVHHKDMLDQFERPEILRPRADALILGLTAFAIGLFKKVFIADPLAPMTELAFGPAADAIAPPFVDAWMGSIAFSLQLYFDFSGYSDMAIGLALMFGIRFPVNFNSPYKAASIIEFWSRWHMTLTRFLTAYVYNPMVTAIARRRARKGKPLFNRSAPSVGPFVVLVAVPTLVTMGLAGIWHGAGWQFVVFGLLHGALLVGNHAWRSLRKVWGIDGSLAWPGRAIAVLVTFLAVTVTLVFFKASSLEHALTVVRGMVGLGGEVALMPKLGGVDPAMHGPWQALLARFASPQGLLFAGALAIVWFLPNVQQYLGFICGPVERHVAEARQALRVRFSRLVQVRPNLLHGGIVGALFGLALLRALSVAPTEFLYFTF